MTKRLVLLDEGERQLLIERYSDLEFVDNTNGFKCVRCNQIPIIHYFTNCGHLLCLNCKRIIDIGGFICAQCKALITKAHEQRYEFERRLLALRTKCPNTKYGCPLTTSLAQIPKHIKTCQFSSEAGLKSFIRSPEKAQILKSPEDMLLALHQKLSIEMRALFNSQMETQKKIQSEELRKLSTKMDDLRSQIVTQVNKNTNNIKTLSDDSRRLQNGLDELNRKFDKLGDDYVLAPKKKVNLLLVGPNGVGKSTFINAFVNYLKFKSLEEAQHSELECLIPCAFTIYEGNSKTHNIKFGEENENENTEAEGKSATQNCKSYKVVVDDLTLTIIDTPGFGDSRGEEQDMRNVRRIIDFVAPYDRLVIAVLLKPNETKLTAAFENCMRKLLSHFYLTATKEVVFLFTNSRSFFYKPGDTIIPLKEILKRLQKPPLAEKFEIKFTKENVFCMDNEAFRYLVAQKNSIKFNANDYDNFKRSWQKSAEECNRMINCIKGETIA